MAVDGTLWRTPYTPENDAAFGRTANVNIQSECVWSARWKSPAICCLSAVAFDSVSEAGEIDLAAQLLAQPPDHSLTIMDKGALGLLHCWQSAGIERHWVLPLHKGAQYEVVRNLGSGHLM